MTTSLTPITGPLDELLSGFFVRPVTRESWGGERPTGFRMLDCEMCRGMLKPDVVFFGETVPARRVEVAMDALAGARALLIAGSSLMVYSGFRFARRAQTLGIPVWIVNRGRTRADDFASHKVEGDIAATLAALVGALD